MAVAKNGQDAEVSAWVRDRWPSRTTKGLPRVPWVRQYRGAWRSAASHGNPELEPFDGPGGPGDVRLWCDPKGCTGGKGMIRERRDEDLERLCGILAALGASAGLPAGADPEAWLREYDAEQSWVFDQAPVTAAPTKNVVGHVQIHAPVDGHPLAEHAGRPAADLLAIARFFVKPGSHEHGIGRYLLKESVKYIQRRERLPVLDLDDNRALGKEFCVRYGFRELSSTGPGTLLVAHST
jgi:GNAT superfamily N-acetyltransferase